MEVNMDSGLIMEATWLNNGPANIPFALTTAGEMFVTYFSYTNELPGASAVTKINNETSAVTVSPNPGKDFFSINYALNKAAYTTVELYNAIGAKVKTIFAGTQTEGKQNMPVDISKDPLPGGVYFVNVSIDGNRTTQRLVINN